VGGQLSALEMFSFLLQMGVGGVTLLQEKAGKRGISRTLEIKYIFFKNIYYKCFVKKKIILISEISLKMKLA
jgi:hypothetical protein